MWKSLLGGSWAQRAKKHTAARRTAAVREALYTLESLEPRVLLSTFVVTSSADGPNAATTNGTLRWAITQANLNAASTITFANGVSGTITLTQGTLVLFNTSATTTITGPGAGALSISGNNVSGVLQIDTNSTVLISGLTITEGSTLNGGGILNNGTLTVTDSTISNNSATGGDGGGILNNNVLTISNSKISNNSAMWGGGIVNGGPTLTITNSTISNDSAVNFGGGLYNLGGAMVVTGCTLSNDASTHGGGGIASFAGTLTIANSTFSNDSTASASGGGIEGGAPITLTRSSFFGDTALFNGGGIESNATLTLTDCTLSANSAGDGGGLYINSGGTLSATNMTVAGNSAAGGGGLVNGGGTVTLGNSIVAGNATTPGGATASDIAGAVSGSYNLIGTGGSGGLANNIDGNQVGVANPLLGPMQNNGGPTQTLALLAGSPAINAGNVSLTTSAGLTTDQRGPGFARVVNNKVDIGAFEVQPGHIYVTNSGNNTIGEYTTSGTTVNAALISGLSGPQGIAVTGLDLFVANYTSGTIGEYTTSGTTVNTALIHGLSGPRGIAISGADIFVANYANGTIGEYTTSGATVNAALISGLGSDGPVDVVVSGSNLFVTNQESYMIGEYTLSGVTVNPSLFSGLQEPYGMAISGSKLFIGSGVNTGANKIGEYTTSGTTVNASLLTGLNTPDLFAVSGANLFVVDAAGTIGEYSTSGATVNAALISGLYAPWGIWVSSQAVWTGGADDNNWATPGNWSGNLVPTQNDDVTIGAGISTINVETGSYAVRTITAASPINIAAGTLTLYGQSTFSDGLTVGGVLQVAADPTLVVVGGGLSVTGTMDMGNNDLIVQNGSLSAITALLKNGYNNGLWNGLGIDSSFAAEHPGMALGAVLGSSFSALHPEQLFDGQSFDSGDVLVKYTYAGDADLSGTVNEDDFLQIDDGFLMHKTEWVNGDFNDDGVVDSQDYALIIQGYQLQVSTSSDVSVAAVVKAVNYSQIGTAAPTLDDDDAYEFDAAAFEAAADAVSSASVTPPGTSALPLTQGSSDLGSSQFHFSSDDYTTQAALDAAYPDGIYQLAINAADDGNHTLALSLTGDLYPAAPHISSFNALNGADPTQSISITWDAMSNGTSNDYIQFGLSDDTGGEYGAVVFETPLPGTAGALSGTATGVTIPAGTLEAGHQYQAWVEFIKWASHDTTDYPSVLAGGVYEAGGDVDFTTGSGTPAQLSLSDGRYNQAAQASASSIVLSEPDLFPPDDSSLTSKTTATLANAAPVSALHGSSGASISESDVLAGNFQPRTTLNWNMGTGQIHTAPGSTVAPALTSRPDHALGIAMSISDAFAKAAGNPLLSVDDLPPVRNRRLPLKIILPRVAAGIAHPHPPQQRELPAEWLA